MVLLKQKVLKNRINIFGITRGLLKCIWSLSKRIKITCSSVGKLQLKHFAEKEAILFVHQRHRQGHSRSDKIKRTPYKSPTAPTAPVLYVNNIIHRSKLGSYRDNSNLPLSMETNIDTTRVDYDEYRYLLLFDDIMPSRKGSALKPVCRTLNREGDWAWPKRKEVNIWGLLQQYARIRADNADKWANQLGSLAKPDALNINYSILSVLIKSG